MSFLGKIKIIMLKGEKGDQGQAGVSGDYEGLANKPSINSVELNGNKNLDDLGLVSQAWVESWVESKINEMILNKHPVGSILMTAEDVNPSTYLGGTWVEWGSGRVPVGVDTSQTEFDTVEETGGEKTHTLTTTEIPSHYHEVNTVTGSGMLKGAEITLGGSSMTGMTSESTGGGQAHNNLQPYITCYMWKRTA